MLNNVEIQELGVQPKVSQLSLVMSALTKITRGTGGLVLLSPYPFSPFFLPLFSSSSPPFSLTFVSLLPPLSPLSVLPSDSWFSQDMFGFRWAISALLTRSGNKVQWYHHLCIHNALVYPSELRSTFGKQTAPFQYYNLKIDIVYHK